MSACEYSELKNLVILAVVLYNEVTDDDNNKDDDDGERTCTSLPNIPIFSTPYYPVISTQLNRITYLSCSHLGSSTCRD